VLACDLDLFLYCNLSDLNRIPKSLNNRGYCFAKLAQFQKAVADYSQVLQCCYMCVLVLQYC
jgi:hypothetical protein